MNSEVDNNAGNNKDTSMNGKTHNLSESISNTNTLPDVVELKQYISTLESEKNELALKLKQTSTTNISIEDVNLKYDVLRRRFEASLKEQEEKSKVIQQLSQESNKFKDQIDSLKDDNSKLNNQLQTSRQQITEFSQVLSNVITPRKNLKSEDGTNDTTQIQTQTIMSPIHTFQTPRKSQSFSNVDIAYTFKYVIIGDTGSYNIFLIIYYLIYLRLDYLLTYNIICNI